MIRMNEVTACSRQFTQKVEQFLNHRLSCQCSPMVCVY